MAKRVYRPVQSRAAQFANSFASEDELRAALLTLLERLPGHSQIRDNQGSNERGKDVLFYIESAFGRKELIGCVLKNGPITGSADSKQGARTVYNQADQCLDTTITNLQGVEEKVAQVYIITPHSCDDHAITSISGKLGKSSRVRFIFGQELFDLFEEYYPEYLLYKSGLFASYVSDLEKGISNDNAVANVLIRHGIGGAADKAREIYVQPNLEIVLSQLSLRLSPPKEAFLHAALSLDAVNAYISDVRHTIRWTSFWSTSTTFPPEQEVTLFTKKLKSSWDRSYDNLVRGFSGAVPLSKREVKVQLNDANELADMFHALTKEALAAVRKLTEDLKRANQLSSSNVSNLSAFISHPHSLDYSYISGVANRTFGLVGVTSPGRKIEFSGGEMLETGRDYVVVAPAGFGKSSFCNRNALHDLGRLKEQQSDLVPILVRLHSLAGKKLENFYDAFLNSDGHRTLWETRNQGQTRRFRFYLDGLDEIPDESAQTKLMNLAADLKKTEQSVQIIVTCRDHVAGDHLRAFFRVNLAEMDDERCQEFVERWLASDEAKIDRFFAQVTKLAALRQLIRVPLLATLVLSVFSSTGTIPESRIRIYDMFVSLMVGGWDIAKNVQRGTQYGSQPKITVLQALAWKLQISGRRDASIFEFNEAVKSQLPSMSGDSTILLREIIQDGLLIQVGSSIAFSHLSFQEYLAAKNLLEPTGKKITLAVNDFLRGQTWWKDVLSFYVAMSSQPREIEIFIRENVRKVAEKTYDPNVLPRARYLLEELSGAYPGCSPSFEFPELAKLFSTQLSFEDIDRKHSEADF